MNYPVVTITGIKNKPFELAQPFRITLSNGDVMYIPKGYWTDFASVPKILRLFIDHVGKDAGAFVMHDYLYNFRGYKVNPRSKKRAEFPVTRRFADREMRIQMKRYGTSFIRRWSFWKAVRAFGWLGFGKI